MTSRYLLDSNIFIQSFNLNYHPSFCSIFWDWVIHGYKAGKFFSIDKVNKELIKPASEDDELCMMLKNDTFPKDFFIKTISDDQIAQCYGQLMNWAYSNQHFSEKAKDTFANGNSADAYLIAAAMAYGYTIVTAEKSNPAAKARILIPDAAQAFDVKCVDLTGLLRKHAHNNFQLQ